MLRTHVTRGFLWVAFIAFTLTTTAVAQTSLSDDNHWEYILAPYLLLPHMNGDTGVGDNIANVDVGPGEIFSKLEFGAMLYFEMANPKWAILFDGLYMDIAEGGQTPVTKRGASVHIQQGMIELTGLWRAAPWAEVGIGGRINTLETNLRIDPGQVLAGVNANVSEVWFDPIIVSRLTVPLENQWRLGLRGDVGGFGIGSEHAWQVYPYAGYRFNDLFELAAAYRFFGMKYETGSSSTKFLYDMVIFGPQIGFLFHF